MSRDTVDVFISYSHDDQALLDELLKHLALLKREGAIHTWHDRDIHAGDEWRGQLDENLESADLILLLVSSSFIASDYCWAVEAMTAFDRHARGEARVVPILVRPCDWKTAPFAEFQGLPEGFEPVTSWADRDLAWLDVVRGLRRVIKALPKDRREPRYADDESRDFSTQLRTLYERRKRLKIAGDSTQVVDGEILDLRRLLRKGPQLLPGEFLLDGRYELLDVLGQGGFATVWKAWDTELEEVVALKVLHGHYAGDRSRRQRFFRGARKMADLVHPHIVRVLEKRHGDDGWHFYVMEYLGGGNFEQAVLAGRLVLRQRLQVVLEIGEALAYAHNQRVIHRDVKPTNLLLDGEHRAKLTDFDLVRAEDTTGLTRTQAMMGTIQFAAPEALESAAAAGAAADVYSLGSTAVFAVLGQRLPALYYRKPEQVIAELNCSEEAKMVLARATAFAAGDRFVSIEAFCHAFRDVVAEGQVRALRGTPTGGHGFHQPVEPGTPEVDEARLFEVVPEMAALNDGSFSMVEFEIPGQIANVRGFWDEHLDTLVRGGKIIRWSRSEGDGVIIGIMVGGELHACALAGSQLLSRSTVTVRTCTPLPQSSPPGSQTPEGFILYPDLPIRGDYLDLVETPQSVHLLEALKQGKVPFSEFRPIAGTGGRGGARVKWSLKLRGRTKPMSVEIALAAGEEGHRAHWMVWPRFRSATGAGWKAYYIYENCTDRRLKLDTLWLQAGSTPEASRVQRRPADLEAVAYPVDYASRAEAPAHTSGPPLALSLRNVARNEEQGLYLVPLKVLPDSTSEVSVGIDFGTSHSAAAVKVGDTASTQVELLSELHFTSASKAITVHISEDRVHVEDSFEEGGLLARGLWFPTYSHIASRGFLLSELLLLEKLEDIRADTVSDWLPAATFLIPATHIACENLSAHVLTDFKRSTTTTQFRGREDQLREHYLGMFLELVMADIVANHLGGFPSHPINMTFTYPLRSTEKQVEAFTECLQRLIRRCSASLGIQAQLQDGVGIYDESRAARLSTKSIGEVVVVGDLGGETLDLFIAACGDSYNLAEVADSACLGGNLLLRQIANSPKGFLPDDGNWGEANGPKDTESKLRAWMRSEGSTRIFGLEAGGRPEFKRMDLRGFRLAAEATRARQLLSRYFRLIVEYMARNLVAYLVRHWYATVHSDVHERLRISIQLRGNGWRLRYQDEDYTQATAAVSNQVRQRAKALWSEIKGNSYPFPDEDIHWEPAFRYAVSDPKGAPIQSIVGQAMPFREAKEKWYSHTLVELEVRRKNGSRMAIDWHEKVPFATRGSRQVQVKGISPPLVLSSPLQGRRLPGSSAAASTHGAPMPWYSAPARMRGAGMTWSSGVARMRSAAMTGESPAARMRSVSCPGESAAAQTRSAQIPGNHATRRRDDVC